MMKNVHYLLLPFIFIQCANPDIKETDHPNFADSLAQEYTLQLDSFGLPLQMAISKDEADELQIKWNQAVGRLEIRRNPGVDFFITQDTLSCAAKKRQAESDIFEISYLMENNSQIVYEARIPDSNFSYFYFFASREIGGEQYIFECNPLVEFRKNEIFEMLELIETFHEGHQNI